jgi:hypothetical protein
MKADAAAKNLPPVYRGKWASASEQEVQAARDAGLECCFRFRVPKVRAWTLSFRLTVQSTVASASRHALVRVALHRWLRASHVALQSQPASGDHMVARIEPPHDR